MKKIALLLATVIIASSVGLFGCRKQNNDWDVYAPDGAPALALGLPMYEDKPDDGMDYHIVSSLVIKTYVTGKNPDAEICLLPVNLAAKLLGDGSVYQMAGVVTHGNLYLLSTNQTQYTKDNLNDLIGKTVGVVQLNNVPGLTFKATLAAANVPYNDLSGGGSVALDKVNLKPIDPKDTTGADVFLLPSPAADARAAATDFVFVGDLQAMYGSGNGYPQAVLVVKKELLDRDADRVNAFLARVAESEAWLKVADKRTVVEAVRLHLANGLSPTFNETTLTDGAIAHSGIRFQVTDRELIAKTTDFLSRLVAIEPTMAAIPDEDFYYQAR